MIDLDLFIKRFKMFKAYDYANDFYEFWRWKIKVEQDETQHILDEKNRTRTHGKLKLIMRAWQTYRPFDSEICLERLESSLEEIASSYYNIKDYSLLNFKDAPVKELRLIWDKLGCVKEPDGRENVVSIYYVIAVAKPLMFLWGQTLTFDSLVRGFMPPLNVRRIGDNRWTFTLWHRAMCSFQDEILNQPEFIELCYKLSKYEFGTDKIVPFGQFIDLYYWIGAKQ